MVFCEVIWFEYVRSPRDTSLNDCKESDLKCTLICNCESTKAGERRVSVLSCSGCFCRSGAADPYVASLDPFPLPICGMRRNQPAGICRNVYF